MEHSLKLMNNMFLKIMTEGRERQRVGVRKRETQGGDLSWFPSL